MRDDEFDLDTPQNPEEETEAHQAEEAAGPDDEQPSREVVIPDGWISYQKYGSKHGISTGRMRYLMKLGRLISKTFPEGAAYGWLQKRCVLDVPPDQHPTTDRDRLPTVPPLSDKYRKKKVSSAQAAKTEERRKQNLRENFLPKFIEKAPPERMAFTAAELLKIFGITQPIFHRDWKKWGLIGRKAPEDYKHLSDGVKLGGEFIYTRRDIVRFLQGEWERSEEGGTPDDIVIGATEGVKALDGMYFNYDRANVYPLDAQGFFDWLEEVGLMIENKRLRKWVPYRLWAVQKEAVKGVLEVDKKGDFTHKIGILCWPRGEGKTVLVCVLTLFFFFNGYSETITLAGNTRDQSKFTHYDLCKGIIQHTPKLRKTPGLEIKEKHIAIKTGPKEMFSYMQPVPTSVGLLPGTTRAIFTELHNLQDTKFFYDLWTSLRNVPNAMVLVDTTVARPGHLVHNLWQTYTKGEDSKIFFHHYADKHYNPEMTTEELNHFRQNMPEILFNMYFRNRWEDAAGSLFPTEKIKEMGVCGLDGTPGVPSQELANVIKQVWDLEIKRNNYAKGKMDLLAVNREIAAIEKRLYPVGRLYKLPATGEDLERIGKIYGCNFVVGVGLDRAQRHSKHHGRTVMSCVARGAISQETNLYFVLDIFIPTESTLPVLADKFLEWSREYGWIDKIAVETYSSQDFYDWASDKALAAEFCAPTFSKQKPLFFSMSNIIDNGQLKCPPVPYYTDEEGKLYKGFTNQDDVFREELEMFNYLPGITEKTGTFGSPEKNKKTGVQDDTVYSVAWAIYATHGEDMVPARRGGGSGIIPAIVNQDVVGDYDLHRMR